MYASRHRVYSERRRLTPRRNIEGAEQATTDNKTAGQGLPRIYIKGVVNCQNSRDKGPPEGNSARR